MKKIINFFLNHPREVNETYWSHFLFAAKGAAILLKISIVLFIHSVLPFLFTTYASDNVNAFAERFLQRSANKNKDPEVVELCE